MHMGRKTERLHGKLLGEDADCGRELPTFQLQSVVAEYRTGKGVKYQQGTDGQIVQVGVILPCGRKLPPIQQHIENERDRSTAR